jgi:hypothetical protein
MAVPSVHKMAVCASGREVVKSFSWRDLSGVVLVSLQEVAEEQEHVNGSCRLSFHINEGSRLGPPKAASAADSAGHFA